MKLLIATHARGAVGGVETYLRGLVPGLMARGHTVALLCEHRFEARSPEGNPTPDPYADCAAEWIAEEDGLGAALAAAQAWAPERVWCHGLASAELEAGLLGLAPALLFAHNYDGTCATGAKFQRWPHPAPCVRVFGAACAPINFTRQCGMPHPAAFAASWHRQRQRAQQFSTYRRILVASHAMAAEYQRHGVAATRLRRLPYPLLEARGAAPAPRTRPPAQVVMLARLTVAKGGAVLLEAMRRAQSELARPLELTIAGEGPERPQLERRARELGLAVSFPGWVTPAQRRQLLADADLLAVPSLWPEPFAMVGLEGFAQGVPAVGFAVGGIPDWLRGGHNGELAPATALHPAGLAAALLRALSNPAHWEELRQHAWESAAEYGLDAYLDRLEPMLSFEDEGARVA